MEEKQVYGLQLLTFLVNKYDYQIVNIKGLPTQDYWLVNLKQKYPLICITNELYTESNIHESIFGQVYRAILSTFTISVKCLILNTNHQSSRFEHQQIVQIPILEDMPVDSSLLETFEGIDHVVRKVKNVSQEKRHLTKILQQKARSQYYSSLKERNLLPKVTFAFMVICVVVFLLINFLAFIPGDEVTAAIMAGAYYKMNVIGAFEYWRLLTSGFVHIDMWHLLMNMIALMNLGPVIERRLKRSQYIITMLVSIIVGNLFVLIGDGNTVTVGISGGLFGLLGVYSVILFSEGGYKNPRVLSSYISTLVINIFISMMPNISLLGHLGGFISGLALGICFSNQSKLKTFKRHVSISFGAVLIACCACIPFVSRITPVYAGTDARIIYTAEQLHLDFYANYLLDRYDAQMASQGEDGYKELLTQQIVQERQGRE
ncbi:rhomboid family intramembrane serine protease [uncultured Traorella sp.]|uniref:rhomboid family intramembrane serine protease n=1 Tax=uncultured Traorella sp. TaxID=1929048 RepID=UPI0025FEB2B8|nr:rhomboid family intramembrane serine protease [uncultured Traorella sp.]